MNVNFISGGVKMKLHIFCLVLVSLASVGANADQFNPYSQDFYNYNGGNYLKTSSHGIPNALVFGTGVHFGSGQEKIYCRLKNKSTDNIQFILKDISNDKFLFQSSNPNQRFYGASISKIFTAGAFFNEKEQITKDERQSLIDMIVKSDNGAWDRLQNAIGDGNANEGKRRTQEFANSIGIFDSTVFRWDLDGVHGNEITPSDTMRFVQASFNKEYEKGHEIFKLFYISKTGAKRLKKYLPKTMLVGGKTGSYTGSTRLDGKPITSKAIHQVIVFDFKKTFYSLVVLSDPGNPEDLAILAGGLYRELIEKSVSCD